MGPVIDEQAYHKVLKYIEIGKEEGVLVTGGEKGDKAGFFIRQRFLGMFNLKLEIMQEEIFGPVVAFAKARDFDHAIEIANHTEYGLTGSVYSRNRAHIEQAIENRISCREPLFQSKMYRCYCRRSSFWRI